MKKTEKFIEKGKRYYEENKETLKMACDKYRTLSNKQKYTTKTGKTLVSEYV